MGFLQYFLFPALAAIVSSLTTILIKSWLENKQKPKLRQNLSGYGGHWFAVHMTRTASGEIVVSRHEYKLDVTRHGVITGTFTDAVTCPALEFDVRGSISQRGMVMIAESSLHASYYSVEFYAAPLFSDEVNQGIITSFDISNNAFSTTILFGRKAPSEIELQEASENMDGMFNLRVLEDQGNLLRKEHKLLPQ